MHSGVTVAESEAEREDGFAVRRAVFVEEQGVPADVEWDDHDRTATHFVAYEDGEAVGAARLRSADRSGVGKVERVAVLPDRRGAGWGRRLMDAVEREAVAEGLDRLKLHSQTHAAEFYRRLGYESYGEQFEEAGIPHVAMEKSLGRGDERSSRSGPGTAPQG